MLLLLLFLVFTYKMQLDVYNKNTQKASTQMVRLLGGERDKDSCSGADLWQTLLGPEITALWGWPGETGISSQGHWSWKGLMVL